MDLKGLGEYVRAQRGRMGLTQRQLGPRLGYSQEWLSKIERGARKRPLTSDEFETLARGLNVPKTELLKAAGYQIEVTNPFETPEGLTVHAWIDRLESVHDLPREAKQGFGALAALVAARDEAGE